MPAENKYIIHVWGQDISSEKDAPLTSVLSLILEEKGWTQCNEKDTDTAVMVVLVSLCRNIQTLPIKDARVFLGALEKKGKVLFVSVGETDLPSGRTNQFCARTELCDWFYQLCILNIEAQWDDFNSWLIDEDAVCSSQGVDPEMVLTALKDYSKPLSKEMNNSQVASSPKLKLLCNLYQKAGSYGYDRVEHDLHNVIYKFKEGQETRSIDDSVLEKSMADDKLALWDGLRYSHLLYGVQVQQKILLIDDKADTYANQLRKALKVFGLDVTVEAINASKDINRHIIKQLAGYRSFHKITGNNWKVVIDDKDVKISDIFGEYRTILVDLLMPGDNGQEEVIGIEVIRGLRRMAIDFATDNPDSYVPDIIALSMADDIQKVQSAMRYGAVGYIFKPRMLGLAGLLGRLGQSRLAREKPVIYNRRNFRQLYELPEETQRLLKRTVIPGMRFDRVPDKPSDEEKAERKSLLPLAKRMSRLLRRIPKTDLHVHVGSCMSPEFLVVASIVMLMRHESIEAILSSYKIYASFWAGLYNTRYKFIDELCLTSSSESWGYKNAGEGIDIIADNVRHFLLEQIDKKKGKETEFRLFRSILHRNLGIPGHWDDKRLIRAIESKSNVDLFLFLLCHGKTKDNRIPDIRGKDDIIRFFLLFQAANSKGYSGRELFFLYGKNKCSKNLLDIFYINEKGIDTNSPADWHALHKLFYDKENKSGLYHELKNNDWKLSRESGQQHVSCHITLTPLDDNLINDLPIFDDDPISWLLATGTRCNNLLGYLEGCEFSGAEHLQHPWLIHLYAQQTSWQFAQQGLMYVELRAAVSGYENRDLGFNFQHACTCMVAAFENATKAVKKRHFTCLQQPADSDSESHGSDFNDWLWKTHCGGNNTRGCFDVEDMNPCFPQKVGLTLTGKRHKPIRTLLREASAAIIFQSNTDESLMSARNFVHAELTRSRFVGFDLAGPEEDFPPELFASEFAQISRMHIPITIHSGENAPPRFVENAVIDLGAKRVGHGLSTVEDPALMNRLREDRICIELCPSSNFQTNQLVPYKQTAGREYPLISYLKNGNAICINTDNPIISFTNIVKEYFMAAWSSGEEGLSLWDLLRIIRMGFIHSFMTVPDRRAMIQLADQALFDLFMSEELVECLRLMTDEQKEYN